MEPPHSAAGQLVAGSLALGAAAWVGATLNSRSVARSNPANATTAAATGAITGSLVALFGATALAISPGKWRSLGATTALVGATGLAALALVGLKASDRLLRATPSAPVVPPPAQVVPPSPNGLSTVVPASTTVGA